VPTRLAFHAGHSSMRYITQGWLIQFRADTGVRTLHVSYGTPASRCRGRPLCLPASHSMRGIHRCGTQPRTVEPVSGGHPAFCAGHPTPLCLIHACSHLPGGHGGPHPTGVVLVAGVYCRGRPPCLPGTHPDRPLRCSGAQYLGWHHAFCAGPIQIMSFPMLQGTEGYQ